MLLVGKSKRSCRDDDDDDGEAEEEEDGDDEEGSQAREGCEYCGEREEAVARLKEEIDGLEPSNKENAALAGGAVEEGQILA